jgi:hypothetical protein
MQRVLHKVAVAATHPERPSRLQSSSSPYHSGYPIDECPWIISFIRETINDSFHHIQSSAFSYEGVKIYPNLVAFVIVGSPAYEYLRVYEFVTVRASHSAVSPMLLEFAIHRRTRQTSKFVGCIQLQ